MRVFEAFRLLLGLLCINQFFQEQLRASGQPVPCWTLRFYRGSIITTKSVGQKLWCGSTTRKLLAVENGVLFHLECSSGDRTPTKAKAALFDAANATPDTSIFETGDLCEVVKRTLSTGQNAGALAKRLEGIEVPFNGSSCNAQHYIDYLSNGKASSNMQSCPVFRPFQSRTDINSPKFKLSGKNLNYDWPTQRYGGALTPTQKTGRQGSNNSMTSRFYSNTSDSRNSWFGHSKKLPQKNSRDINTTNRQAESSCIGHFSSSGGHGSSGGGHGSSGGHGSGSRGGSDEGGEGSSGSRGTGGNNYYAAGSGGHRHHSSGSKPVPMWGFKLLTFGSEKGYWPRLNG